MEVVIRGKKTTFDESVVSKLNYKEFEELCLNIPSFIQLPKKERKIIIKELYGKFCPNAKKIPKPESGFDIHNSDVKPDRGGVGTESSANDGRKDIEGKKDKANIQNKTIRSKKKETES